MGVYRAAIVTENGQNLIAQALANEKPLIFTSAKTSSYSYPVGTDVPALTGLQDVVQSVLPFDSKVLGGNVAQVSVRFDNDGVDQTYRIETIGLYAKIEGGAETLFSVTQATTPDEMPVQSDISPSAYIYNIQHTVQNASQITLTVNPAGTATVQDIMDIESPEFDDSGTVEGISSFPSFLETMKSKMNFFQFFRNLKAGLQFVLHTGQIVNNCVTDNSSLPLSAAQGKALMDKYTQLYSDLAYTSESLTQPPSEYCTFSQWIAVAERVCNEVTLTFNVSGSIVPASTLLLLMTIPEKYRPKNYKYVSYRTQDGYDMLVIIQTDGKVLLFNNNKAVSGLFLRQTITYPAT